MTKWQGWALHQTRAAFHVAIKEREVNVEKRLPFIAQRFIELGEEVGVGIEITYGLKQQDDGIHAGYKVSATGKGKCIFISDYLIEEDTPENINKAVAWFEYQLTLLKPTT